MLSNSDKFVKADLFPFLLLALIVLAFAPGKLSVDALFKRRAQLGHLKPAQLDGEQLSPEQMVEKIRQQIQKELGLTVGPKDPLLALWVAQQEFLEETAAEHQKLLSEFEAALGRSQTMWTDQAKGLANQSLNAALRAARDSTVALVEEAARTNAGVVRAAVQEGVERLEQALVVSRRIAWVSLTASIVALAASMGSVLARLLH
jgi:hypothetical protein